MLTRFIKNNILFFLLFVASNGVHSQAIVTLNPYMYYNKLPGDYLYYTVVNQVEILSQDQLAYVQIRTLGDFYNHAFTKEKFYDFKNMEKFLKGCQCEDFKQLIKEFDKWYTLHGYETFRNGYSSEHSRALIGAITSKYYNQNMDDINEYLNNWFFKQNFFIQPDGTQYIKNQKPLPLVYKIPYINDIEEYNFNKVGNLIPLKKYYFTSNHINYFRYDSINGESIFKYTFGGFLLNQKLSQVKNQRVYLTSLNYKNIKIKEFSSDKFEERFYHSNGVLSFSLPYGAEIESVIGYDSIGNVSYKNGNGTIYNILDSDDENISYTRIYKSYNKIFEKEYFGDLLIKSREFSKNVETTRKSYHWKNGLVIKEEPYEEAECIKLYHNYPKSGEIKIEKIFMRILPNDLVNNLLHYPISSSNFIPAELLNEKEIHQLVEGFINDPNSAESISQSPILEFFFETTIKPYHTEQFSDNSYLQNKVINTIKISPAKYNGKAIDVPIGLYITVLLK